MGKLFDGSYEKHAIARMDEAMSLPDADERCAGLLQVMFSLFCDVGMGDAAKEAAKHAQGGAWSVNKELVAALRAELPKIHDEHLSYIGRIAKEIESMGKKKGKGKGGC